MFYSRSSVIWKKKRKKEKKTIKITQGEEKERKGNKALRA